jgi:signal transduction histidine kinase
MQETPGKWRQITIHTRCQNGAVRVSVRDHGCGIPPERLSGIFNPFYTTKSTGLGMGLAICRRLIETHGGHIEARNHDEGGATFCFSLPAIESDRRQPNPQSRDYEPLVSSVASVQEVGG